MKLGIDIGFGDVKVIIEPNGDGQKQFKFPTAIKSASMSNNEFLNEMAKNEEYLFEGRKYLVGSRASHQAFSTRSLEFMKRYSPVFTYVAIKKAEAETGQSVSEIGLGLPLSFYSEQNRTELVNRVKVINVNNDIVTLKPTVFVQGYGVLIDYLGSIDEAKAEGIRNMMVIDVGFNTVDIINVEEGKVTREGSDTLENNGVSKITSKIIQALRGTHNLSQPEAVELIMKGTLSVYAEDEDHSELIRQVTEEYIDWLFNEIETNYTEIVKRAEKIIIAGGGAYLLQHYLPPKYARMIFIPQNPEFANARGFLRLLEDREIQAEG